ncbi:MAG: transglutaminase-like domain-containing protein [Candidatus Bathyarchaeia archaeon]
MPTGFKTLAADYLGVMKNLNSSQTKAKMAALLNPNCNQTDLFAWEASKLTFASDPSGSFEDPFQILETGDGICVQWSIVYVSACLALGYQSRLVVAVDTTSWTFIHTWAEDYNNGTWVHVDPADKVWNDPSRYLSWDWGQYIGSTVRIYAFEDGSFQDVTSTYSAQ